jgi:hypothetical protein
MAGHCRSARSVARRGDGWIAASLGPIAAFGLAGGAGMLAVLAAALRQATLPGAPGRREKAAAPAAASG